MKCPKCEAKLRKVMVKVERAKSKAKSYQCPKCNYYEFDQESTKKVVEELRESSLRIKQKIVKLSQDRLGMYFNKHVIESLNLKKGNEIYISVPDKNHILITIEK